MENQVENVVQSDSANTPSQEKKIVEETSTDTGSAIIPGRDNERKIFVGGLTRDTNEKDLQDYFAKFGVIQSVSIKMDQETGNSKSFGFIVFDTVESVNKVIAAGDHVIKNKKIDAQVAKVRHGKIFVGGITSEITDDDIKSYFGQFGNIVGVEMPMDKTNNQRKNFCFIIFETEDMAKEVLKNSKQTIKNKVVDVKRAVNKTNQGGSQGFSSRGRNSYGFSSYGRNSYGFGQSFDQPQPYGNQTYGGYDFNHQGYGTMYGGYSGHYGTYGTAGYENYGNSYQNTANASQGAAVGRGAASRGASRGTTRGTNRGAGRGAGRGASKSTGRGNRFQPF